jgi:hypothetical protein
MLVTLLGIVMDVSLLIFMQRSSGILSTALPNVNDVILLAALANGFTELQFLAFQTIVFKPEQP